MPASFQWAQTIGAPSGTTSLLGASGNLVNFKNIDGLGTTNYATNPVPAGSNSYELWLRGNWGGTFNNIYDVRFWMSTDFSPNTGLTVRAKTNGQTSYQQPTNATSSLATSIVSTSDPGTANVSIGGSLSSSLSSSGFSDFIVLQLQTTTNAPAGDTSLATFSMSYVEV
jgi:hypothetical protein